MVTHTAADSWERGEQGCIDNQHSRAQTWRFDSGIEVPGSSPPEVLLLLVSNSAAIDPKLEG
jgi:hypothetical protein